MMSWSVSTFPACLVEPLGCEFCGEVCELDAPKPETET